MRCPIYTVLNNEDVPSDVHFSIGFSLESMNVFSRKWSPDFDFLSLLLPIDFLSLLLPIKLGHKPRVIPKQFINLLPR